MKVTGRQAKELGALRRSKDEEIDLTDIPLLDNWKDMVVTEPRIVSVNVTGEAIVAHLADGRIVSVPLEWSWRLTDATPEQRAHWEIIGNGQGVHWPDVDEDISVEGMLRGIPARRPATRAQHRGRKAKPIRPATR